MGRIEDLKKRLYKDEPLIKKEKEPIFIPDTNINTSSGWGEKEPFDFMEKMRMGQKPRLLKRWSFWLSISFFLFITAAGIFAYVFFIGGGGIGAVSSKNIDMEIEAPVNAKGGEKISWGVAIRNNNKAALEDVNLIVEYPEGATILGDSGESLIRRKNIGLIVPGEAIRENFEAFVFGPKDSDHTFKASLEYRIKDSGAIFEKSESHTLSVIQTPVSVSYKSPNEINIGKEFQIEIFVSSNSEGVLKGLVLEIEYPEGFEYKEAFPEPQSRTIKRWSFGDLASKSQKSVAVKGKLTSDLPEAGFKIFVGTLKDDKDLQVLDAGAFLIAAQKSFLDIKLSVNRESSYIAERGEKLKIDLFWLNNLPVVIKNAILELNFSGEALNLETLSIENGFFRGDNNAVVWNSSVFPDFSVLEPGEEGVLSVNVNVLNPLPIKSDLDKNFKILLKARFFSEKIPEEYKNTDIEGRDEKEIKIVSDIQFAQKGLYYAGDFKNTGPLPPKVGEETTYTIAWSVVNFSNDISNLKLNASLPNYIKWLNAVEPSSKNENISFNEESREIVWAIDKLSAGTGVIKPAEEISFQIGYIPTINQVGSSPILISEAAAEGTDDFTGVILRDSKPTITTDLKDDPKFEYKEGRVIK